MAFDILEETPFGIDFTDDPDDLGPQVPRIVLSPPVAGEGERLAGISSSEDMNLSTPSCAVEGCNITPDRRLIQGLVFHPCHERCRRESFPLNETYSSISGLGDMKANFETADPGAECDAAKPFMFGM